MTDTSREAKIDKMISDLEAATGSDRKLDARVYLALIKPEWVAGIKGAVAKTKKHLHHDGSLKYHSHNSSIAPLYTSSIDACLALVERVLGTYTMKLEFDLPMMGVGAKIFWWPEGLTKHENQIEGTGLSMTAPIATLIALLKALKGGVK